MTDFYLVTAEDPAKVSIAAEHVDAMVLGKIDQGLGLLGKLYSGKLVYIVDPSQLAGHDVEERIKRGSRDAGVAEPRIRQFRYPSDALTTFLADEPAAVAASYRVSNDTGMTGAALILAMKKVEQERPKSQAAQQ